MTVEPELDAATVGRVQRRTVGVLAAGQVLGGIAFGATVSLGALLAADLSGQEALSGLATASVTLGAAIAAIPLARLAGTRGRRLALTAGNLLALVGMQDERHRIGDQSALAGRDQRRQRVLSDDRMQLRAVLDLPLGDVSPRQPWAVMVNILGGPQHDTLESRFPAVLEAHPAVKVHTYGKAPRPGRKVGHVNAVGDDLDTVVYEARAAAAFFAD